MAPRGEVDEPLDDEHDLRAARAPVGRGRRRVGDHGAAVHRHRRHVVDRGRDGHALVERVERHGVGADVAGVGAAKPQECPVGVERQLGAHREVAPPVVGHERLAPLARPLHRAPESPRGPGDQHELGVAAVAGAEVSADLARRDADRALGNAERAGHAGLRPPEPARAGVDGVAAARRVPHADRRARLHRHAGHPLHPRLEPHDVGGARERALDGRRVSDLRIDAHVRLGFGPEDRRVRGGRGEAPRHGGQRLPVRHHALGSVARRRRRVGDDHGDDGAHEARTIGGHRRMRGHEEHVARADDLFVGVRRHRRMRDGLHAVGGGVAAGQHGDHARRGERGGGVDAHDSRVSVRRAHEAGVGLARQVDVVAVAAAARQQARVFLAKHRLADPLGSQARPGGQEGHRAHDSSILNTSYGRFTRGACEFGK